MKVVGIAFGGSVTAGIRNEGTGGDEWEWDRRLTGGCAIQICASMYVRDAFSGNNQEMDGRAGTCTVQVHVPS